MSREARGCEAESQRRARHEKGRGTKGDSIARHVPPLSVERTKSVFSHIPSDFIVAVMLANWSSRKLTIAWYTRRLVRSLMKSNLAWYSGGAWGGEGAGRSGEPFGNCRRAASEANADPTGL